VRRAQAAGASPSTRPGLPRRGFRPRGAPALVRRPPSAALLGPGRVLPHVGRTPPLAHRLRLVKRRLPRGRVWHRGSGRTLQGSWRETRDLIGRSRFCLSLKRNVPGCGFRGRFLEASCHVGDHSENRDPAARHAPTVAAVAYGWRALALEPGVWSVQVDRTVRAHVRKSQVARSSDLG
jgi:hypothetical protein